MTNASAEHDHTHFPNRFAVIPTHLRLNADPNYNGRGVTIAFLDSGFYAHPDLVEPINRIIAFKDVSGETASLESNAMTESWRWHGTQTSVVAAGNGQLCAGIYKGLAFEAQLALVKVSEAGLITEDNISRGLEWVIENREKYNIRVLNISLGADEDVPCSRSIIDQAAEEAVKRGIVVVAAAGNSGNSGQHSIPPANSPSVITVGGYNDRNSLQTDSIDLYHSNFGATADGSIKPEIIAPAMWVAAPILPATNFYDMAETLSILASAPDYQLRSLFKVLGRRLEISDAMFEASPEEVRSHLDRLLTQNRIVATHYQHVDGTSFAAPIVSAIVAQMIQANPRLTPGAAKNILVSTADRIANAVAIRQGYGVVNARRAVALARTEQHALRTVGCGPPRIADGRLVFVFHHDEAESVSLAGDFNNWDATGVMLAKNSEGLWQAEIEAPEPGVYQYKFLVDRNYWLEDPGNAMKAPDNYGGMNSLLVIE